MQQQNTDVRWNGLIGLMLQCYTLMLYCYSYSQGVHICLQQSYITMLHYMSVSTFIDSVCMELQVVQSETLHVLTAGIESVL